MIFDTRPVSDVSLRDYAPVPASSLEPAVSATTYGL
jgi:hypothetical protein